MKWPMMSLSSAVILSPSLGASSGWLEEAVFISLMLLCGVVSPLSPKFSENKARLEWYTVNVGQQIIALTDVFILKYDKEIKSEMC